MINWPGKKVNPKHVLVCTGVRAVYGAWSINIGKSYHMLSRTGSAFYVRYYGPSPGLFEVHPDITISFAFISFCSKLNVFKSN